MREESLVFYGFGTDLNELSLCDPPIEIGRFGVETGKCRTVNHDVASDVAAGALKDRAVMDVVRENEDGALLDGDSLVLVGEKQIPLGKVIDLDVARVDGRREVGIRHSPRRDGFDVMKIALASVVLDSLRRLHSSSFLG
jgi:hypothetical protein